MGAAGSVYDLEKGLRKGGNSRDGVDVGLVTSKGLHRLARPDIPHLGGRVARSRDKHVLIRSEGETARRAKRVVGGSAYVGWKERRRGSAPHDVSGVVVELDHSDAGINVPQHATHVARRGEDLAIVQEPTAREVTRVGAQFARDLDRPFARPQVVDRADVVEPSARDKVARGGVGAGHDPRGPERDRVDLVRGVGVPDDEFAVL